MKPSQILAVLLAVPLAACTVGGTGDDDGGDDGPPPPDGTLTGSITSSRTVSGVVAMTGDVTVETGATLTIAAGTMIEVATGRTLRVHGGLEIAGVAGQEVDIVPTAMTWAGIVAESGSTVNVAYVNGMDVANFLYSKPTSTATIDHVTMLDVGRASQVEGTLTITRSSFTGIMGVTIFPTGNLTVSDSHFIGTSGDTVVQTGGDLTMSYTNVGNTSTGNDHCAMHLNEDSTANVSFSNISDTSVGLMVGGTVGSNFTDSNFENLLNVQDTSSGTPNSGGTFARNYMTGTPPTITGMPLTAPAGAPILTAGPRP